ISQLASQFPAQARNLFDADELGEETAIPAVDLVRAATDILGALETGTAKVGYSYRLEWRKGDQTFSTSTGMQRQINGIDHSLQCGRDQCTLQALYRGPDGVVKDKGPLVDMRGQTSFRFDSGEVFIRRSPGNEEIAKLLKKS